jgi:chromosome segregation ATPase
MKMELRSEFADKNVLLGARKDLDELRNRLKSFERGDTNPPHTDSSAAEKSIEELRREFFAFRAGLFEHEKEESADASLNTLQRSHDEHLEEKEDEQSESKREQEADSKAEGQNTATTISLPKKNQISLLSIKESQKALRQLSKRVKELDEKVERMNTSPNNNEEALKDLNKRIKELSQSVEKKANALDMKSVLASISELNEHNNSIKSEVASIDQSLTTLATADETKVLKGKVSSLESKLTYALNSMKEFQTKFSEFSSLQPILPTEEIEEEGDKEEDRMNYFMDETNKKIKELKLIIEKQDRDFVRLSNSVNEQLNSKASIESLIELENKIYKEFDKVLYTLGKKIATIDCRKEVSSIQIRVKKLYEVYLGSVSHLKEHADEASLIKRSLEGISCISCDKDVSNVYEQLNQSHDYVNWNKFPQRDLSLLHPKVLFI